MCTSVYVDFVCQMIWQRVEGETSETKIKKITFVFERARVDWRGRYASFVRHVNKANILMEFIFGWSEELFLHSPQRETHETSTNGDVWYKFLTTRGISFHHEVSPTPRFQGLMLPINLNLLRQVLNCVLEKHFIMKLWGIRSVSLLALYPFNMTPEPRDLALRHFSFYQDVVVGKRDFSPLPSYVFISYANIRRNYVKSFTYLFAVDPEK